MCLSKVYRAEDHALLMDNTARITTDRDTVCLQDLFGRIKRVKGSILNVDLEANVIVLDCVPEKEEAV